MRVASSHTFSQGIPSATLTQCRCKSRLMMALFWSSLNLKASTCKACSVVTVAFMSNDWQAEPAAWSPIMFQWSMSGLMCVSALQH